MQDAYEYISDNIEAAVFRYAAYESLNCAMLDAISEVEQLDDCELSSLRELDFEGEASVIAQDIIGSIGKMELPSETTVIWLGLSNPYISETEVSCQMSVVFADDYCPNDEVVDVGYLGDIPIRTEFSEILHKMYCCGKSDIGEMWLCQIYVGQIASKCVALDVDNCMSNQGGQKYGVTIGHCSGDAYEIRKGEVPRMARDLELPEISMIAAPGFSETTVNAVRELAKGSPLEDWLVEFARNNMVLEHDEMMKFCREVLEMDDGRPN